MKNFMEDVCKIGMYLDNVETLILKDVSVEGAEGEDVIANNVGKIIK
jgi:hypothetical protein